MGQIPYFVIKYYLSRVGMVGFGLICNLDKSQPEALYWAGVLIMENLFIIFISVVLA